MIHQLHTARIVRSGALGVVVLVCAICWLGGGQTVRARQPEKKVDYPAKWKEDKDLTYDSSALCTQCHVTPLPNTPKTAFDIVLLSEYTIWKSTDKHAQAYAVLVGDRGQRIGESLFGQEKKGWVTKEEGGCLNCHAMNNSWKETEKKKGMALEGIEHLQDGVSCSGCHGPSSQWIGPHSNVAWRKKTSEEKEMVGLRDLRDPKKRADLCMSCHVGNVAEGKVVTHAMMAAGHPPLPPIEISSFSRNMPQHWRDPQYVPYFKTNDPTIIKNYHLESMNFQRSRIALTGSVVALRESMKLARDRANLEAANADWTWWPELRDTLDDAAAKDTSKVKAEAKGRWPELAMAHSDCFSCHHDLKVEKSYRQQRGFGYQLSGRPMIRTIPGRPLVRTWSLGTIEFGVDFVGKANQLDSLENMLRGVAKVSNARPYGDPKEIFTETDAVVKWCDDLLNEIGGSGLYTRKKAIEYMEKLCAAYSPNNPKALIPDYETARLLASVVKALYEEVLLEGKDMMAEQKTAELFAALDQSLNLQPYKNRAKRAEVVLEIVRSKSTLKDAPKAKEDIAKFSAFAADVNNADPTTMKGNLLLNVFLTGFSNKDFTDGLIEPKVVETLQKLSDAEEQGVLDAVRGYDPKSFKEQLDKIAKALPKP